MICPLFVAGMLADPQVGADGEPLDSNLPLARCVEDECGWWIPEAEMCAAKAMGMAALGVSTAAENDNSVQTFRAKCKLG